MDRNNQAIEKGIFRDDNPRLITAGEKIDDGASERLGLSITKKVKFWQHVDRGGYAAETESDLSNLKNYTSKLPSGKNWNDRISSAEAMNKTMWEFWQHANYYGSVRAIYKYERSFVSLGFNDTTSSIKFYGYIVSSPTGFNIFR